MKMVAAAKLRRAQDRAIASRPYAKLLREVLASVSARVTEPKHPLLASREEKRVTLMIVAGDRGLAGAFNANVHRTVLALLAEKRGWESVTILPIGKKALDYWKKRAKLLAPKSYPGIFARVEYAHAKEIAAYLATEFTENRTDAVYFVVNEFKSVIAQTVRIVRVLPIERGQAAVRIVTIERGHAAEGVLPAERGQTAVTEASGERLADFIYEPDAETILARLLPRYLEFGVFRALLESAAAEHAARMTAMDSASRNAGELIDSLTLTYNRARQARITKELIEIVSGSAAQE